MCFSANVGCHFCPGFREIENCGGSIAPAFNTRNQVEEIIATVYNESLRMSVNCECIKGVPSMHKTQIYGRDCKAHALLPVGRRDVKTTGLRRRWIFMCARTCDVRGSSNLFHTIYVEWSRPQHEGSSTCPPWKKFWRVTAWYYWNWVRFTQWTL